MTRITGRSVLTVLVAFFAVVVAINVIFIVEAASTFRGEDEQRPYLQGIDYNRTLRSHAEQAAAGWSATLSVDREPSGTVTVLLSMHDRNGQPLDRLSFHAILRHPSDATRDRTLALKPEGGGIYTGTIGAPGHGARDLLVRLSTPELPSFEAERRIWLP